MGGLGPGIGGFEYLVIALVALLVVGPERLPLMLRKLGQWVAKARAMANEFRSSFDEMARQSELDELRKEVEALRRGQSNLTPLGAEADAAFRDIRNDLSRPLHAPAPAPAPALESPDEWPDSAPVTPALDSPSPAPPEAPVRAPEDRVEAAGGAADRAGAQASAAPSSKVDPKPTKASRARKSAPAGEGVSGDEAAPAKPRAPRRKATGS